MKLIESIGAVTVAFLAAACGCQKPGHTRPPAPSVEISMQAMLINFAHLQQLPVMKTAHGKTAKADAAGPQGHGKAAQARDFMQMEIHLPHWVAATISPEPTRILPPQKHRFLQSSAPTSGNLGTFGSTLKRSSNKVSASASDSVIGIE